ncbi:MAG: 3-deoxy-manno-octulosonate-8-phosphatase KdsC [Methylococcales bacterium]|nr:3-deoxy-manno-octulosonate-8-phosphatase KdsC [Methylococcales bacterium]
MTQITVADTVLAKARAVRLLVLDVDGVLTDGRLFFDHEGREYKTFHARDGHGLKLLKRCGIEVAVISGRRSDIVELRMRQLGIEHVYQGHEDKVEVFTHLLTRLALPPEACAMVGDDWLDLPLLRRAGLAVAVQDAHDELSAHVDWVTTLPGGQGAVREVCDLLMRAQGHWQARLEHYLCA